MLLAPFAYGAARTCPGDEHWHPVGSGVWVWAPKEQADISRHNLGHVLSTSVIVDGGDAMVIDPGPSHLHAEKVIAWVRCRWQSNIRWVINTHAHAENVLGNSAFWRMQRSGRLDIGASASTLEAMQRRCKQCLAHLQETLGQQLMQSTRIVLPNRRLLNGSILPVGARRLQILLLENAHTESDTVLWDPIHRLAWVGGLVYESRVPELAQGSLDGWLSALQKVEDLRPAAVIGTGVTLALDGNPPAGLLYTRRYLSALRTAILKLLDTGKHASEGADVQLPEFSASAGYSSRHSLNVQRGWREMESVWMNAEPTEASAPDVRR